jgi:crossover junction endodeoxyribonuclease RusA
MEIEFPIEFIVYGTPVSLQAKRPASREGWKERVWQACVASIPSPHFASDQKMSVTLYYLPNEAMQGDIDNIVKPILDALNKRLYIDDKQVERILVQKFEPNNVFTFNSPTEKFNTALSGKKPVLYVKISNKPLEEII